MLCTKLSLFILLSYTDTRQAEQMVFVSFSTQCCRALTATTSAPDFAPLHPVCRSSSSLLWPTNSVHDLSLARVIGIRVIQNTQFSSEEFKEEQNHEVYNLASISSLAHCGPHGSFYGQAVRSMSLAGRIKLRTSRIRAVWTAISSPLIHSLFKSTWLAF